MAPLHGLLLKEPRALEKKMVFVFFHFVGLGKPRKTREGKGNHITGVFLLPFLFVLFFGGPDHIVLFSASSLVTCPKNSMA